MKCRFRVQARCTIIRQWLRLAHISNYVYQEIGRLRQLSVAEEEADFCTKWTINIVTPSSNFNTICDEQRLIYFCFTKAEISRICELFPWEVGCTMWNKYRGQPLNALARKCKYRGMKPGFGMHASALSQVFRDKSICAYNKLLELITMFCSNMICKLAPLYASCIHESGVQLEHCFGFIDGTKIKMSSPGGAFIMQRACYSKRKRMHCLVYQTIKTQDGLIFPLYGSVEGRYSGASLYRQSGIDNELCTHLGIDDEQYCIYRDKP